MKKLRGKIKFFNHEDEYGFIIGPEGNDIYFNKNCVFRTCLKYLKAGTPVEFSLKCREDGKRYAVKVRTFKEKTRPNSDGTKDSIRNLINRNFPGLENGNVVVIDGKGQAARNMSELCQHEIYSCALSHSKGYAKFYCFLDPSKTWGKIIILSKNVARDSGIKYFPMKDLKYWNSRKLRKFYPEKVKASDQAA